MMNYRTVLRDFSPIEQGDFLMRFVIHQRNYVLFSPEHGKVSCLELMYFTELAPPQLSVLIQVKEGQEPMDEFVFRSSCSKDRLIDYLFDVRVGEDSVKHKHVSGWRAYLMMDVVREDKVRNIFQFNTETKESMLSFDNRCCAAGVRTGEKGNTIHFCWNPSIFFAIDKGGERNAPAYLLASDSHIVHAYAIKRISECFANIPQDQRIIGVHVGHNVYESLSFISYYVRTLQKEMNVIIERKGGVVTMEISGWNPIHFSNYVSSLNTKVREVLKIDQETVFLPFSMISLSKRSFLVFPDSDVFLKIFLNRYIEVLKINELTLVW